MENKKSSKMSFTASIKKKFFSKKKSSKTEKKDGSDKKELPSNITEKDEPVKQAAVVTCNQTTTKTPKDEHKKVKEALNKEEEARCSTSSDNSIIIQEINQDEDEEEKNNLSEEKKEDVLSEKLAEKENSVDYPTPNINPVVKHSDNETTQVQKKPPPNLGKEFRRLAKQGWYWGPITRAEAEEKMVGQLNGSFLVRDSSDDRYLLSLSFRSNDRTLHTRFEHFNGTFSFYVNDQRQTFNSVVDLIDTSMEQSIESGIFCYSRSREPTAETYPVKLMHPVSRLTEVRSLQYLCRFVIRQLTRIDHLEQLPLPLSVKGFVSKKYF